MERIKVFLDTNIVIDYYTGRMGDGIAEKIVQAGEHPEYELCISLLTGINALYVLNKFSSEVGLSTLSSQFHVLPMSESQWDEASGMQIDDPEDALQIACARESGCKVIISRDRHLLESGIQSPAVLSPEEFISQISLGQCL